MLWLNPIPFKHCIQLEWTYSDASLIEYSQIFFSTNPGVTSSSTLVGKHPRRFSGIQKFIITGLNPTTTYYFRVYSYDINNAVIEDSTEVSTVTLGGPAPDNPEISFKTSDFGNISTDGGLISIHCNVNVPYVYYTSDGSTPSIADVYDKDLNPDGLTLRYEVNLDRYKDKNEYEMVAAPIFGLAEQMGSPAQKYYYQSHTPVYLNMKCRIYDPYINPVSLIGSCPVKGFVYPPESFPRCIDVTTGGQTINLAKFMDSNFIIEFSEDEGQTWQPWVTPLVSTIPYDKTIQARVLNPLVPTHKSMVMTFAYAIPASGT